MYARKLQNQTLDFDITAALHQDNLLFTDRQTGSLWSQLEGQAISGPLKGAGLEIVPSVQTTWRYWKRAHPDTLVMASPGGRGIPYTYRDPGLSGFSQTAQPAGHDTSTLGLGLTLNGESLFLPWTRIRKAKAPIEVEVGGRRLRVRTARDGMTAWAENQAGEMVPAVLAYKRAWLRFHPDSKIYRRPNKKKR